MEVINQLAEGLGVTWEEGHDGSEGEEEALEREEKKKKKKKKRKREGREKIPFLEVFFFFFFSPLGGFLAGWISGATS